MRTGKCLAIGALVALSVSSGVSAQNSTAGTATRMPVEADWVNSTITTTQAQRWYQVGFWQGRSYCVVTGPNENTIDLATVDTYTYVYSDFAGTVLVQANDDDSREPTAGFYSRNCFIYTAASNTSAKVAVELLGGGLPSVTRYFRIRVMDTTIDGPWFYVDGPGGYQGYIELSNTTSTSVNITATIRGSNGATLGTPQSRTIPAYGQVLLNARTDFGTTIAAATGSVSVAHNGPPGALKGNITTLSALTGLSFDAPMSRRESQ